MTVPPPDWPAGLSPPLFADQAEAVLEAWPWMQAGLYFLVLVRCPDCREPVMDVTLPHAPDPDDPDRYVCVCPTGAVVRGTVRARNADIRLGINRGTRRRTRCGCAVQPCAIPEHYLTGERPRRDARHIPLDDQWLAILNRVTTATLPAWCDRHGALTVGVEELRHRARDVERRVAIEGAVDPCGLTDKSMTAIRVPSTPSQ